MTYASTGSRTRVWADSGERANHSINVVYDTLPLLETRLWLSQASMTTETQLAYATISLLYTGPGLCQSNKFNINSDHSKLYVVNATVSLKQGFALVR